MNLSSRVSTVLLPALCLLAGAGGAVMVWGHSTEERIQLLDRQQEFLRLTEQQQHLIRLSNADFQEQSPSRRSEIESIFEATSQNPRLRETMDRYYTWWSSLSNEEWDRFRDMSTDERLSFVKYSWATKQKTGKEITVEFPGRSASGMPTLHLTFKEYETIIFAALADAKKPESLETELAALSSDKHRALRLTLWMFDSFPAQRDPAEMRERGQQFASALLTTVRDEAWKKYFSKTLGDLKGKSFERAWMFMTIFTIMEKATETLGENLREEFPVTPRQIINAFASLQDKTQQHALMVMPAEEARTRLELLAQTENAETPEQQLLARYNRFARERERIMRLPFGFGAPGPGPGPGTPPLERPAIPPFGDGRRSIPNERTPAEGGPRNGAPGRP